MDLAIRPATPADVSAVNALRNHFIRTCPAIYTTVERPDDQAMDDFDRRDQTRHPLLIATLDGQFAGYGSLSAFDPNLCGYRDTVEDSVYVDPESGGRGVGRALLTALLDAARDVGHRNVIARIDSSVGPSLALHRKHGFIDAGTLRGVGEKFGRRLDVIYLQYQVDTPAA